jgi:hypothetical protein
MNRNKLIGGTIALAGLSLVGPAEVFAAIDKPVFTFGFTELDGDYNDFGDRTGSFTAVASSANRSVQANETPGHCARSAEVDIVWPHCFDKNNQEQTQC